MKPYTYVCTTCGSDNVSLEGFIHWDTTTQRHRVSDLCDGGHSCNDCDGECSVETIDVPGTANEALEEIAHLAETFVGDWLSDDGMSVSERKEARHAEARMKAAIALLREAVAV